MSNFVEGQGIIGKIRFVDGELPEYNRTYLIINVTSEYIEVLNVSSIRGKERKLAFSTNERLRSFKPPFVKLDSLTQVKRADWSELQVLHNGATLDQGELDRIKKLL